MEQPLAAVQAGVWKGQLQVKQPGQGRDHPPLLSTPYTTSKILHLISKPQLKQNKTPPAHKH